MCKTSEQKAYNTPNNNTDDSFLYIDCMMMTICRLSASVLCRRQEGRYGWEHSMTQAAAIPVARVSADILLVSPVPLSLQSAYKSICIFDSITQKR